MGRKNKSYTFGMLEKFRLFLGFARSTLELNYKGGSYGSRIR